MRSALSVTTSAAQAVSSDTARDYLVVQNNSDETWSAGLGTADDALTMENGILLAAGDTLILTGALAQVSVFLMHAGTGTKAGSVQGGRLPK